MTREKARDEILASLEMASDPVIGRDPDRMLRLVYATGFLVARVPEDMRSLAGAALINAQRRAEYAIANFSVRRADERRDG